MRTVNEQKYIHQGLEKRKVRLSDQVRPFTLLFLYSVLYSFLRSLAFLIRPHEGTRPVPFLSNPHYSFNYPCLSILKSS